MREVAPLLDEDINEELAQFLHSRPFSVFFDGATNNHAVEAILVRVTVEEKVLHRAIALQPVDTEADALMVKGILLRALQRRGLSLENSVAFECDSAAVNLAALRSINHELGAFHHEERVAQSVHVFRCCSHGATNSANKLSEACSDALTVLRGLKGLHLSRKARGLFKTITGIEMPFQAENRWLYWHKMATDILSCWNHLWRFVQRCRDSEIMPRKLNKLSCLDPNNLSRCLRVGLELTLMSVVGRPLALFVAAMEGDSMLSPYAYAAIQEVSSVMNALEGGDHRAIAFNALIEFSRQHGGNIPRSQCDALCAEVWRQRKPMIQHWRSNTEKWGDMLVTFKGLSLLDPEQLVQLSPHDIDDCLTKLQQAEVVPPGGMAQRYMTGIKGVTSHVLIQLRAELPSLLERARTRVLMIQEHAAGERQKLLWPWWWSLRQDLPTFFFVAQRAVLIQPSTAVVERLFSVVKQSTSSKQSREKMETMERRALVLYNDRQ